MIRLALFFGLAVLVMACGRADERPRILIAAASDLRYAFEAMEPLYEARCGCDLVFSFGSSGMLATQIAEGMRMDVFASADASYVEDLERRGLLLEGTKQLYAIGRIALAVPASSTARIESLEDLRGVRTISIANPDHAPYGRAARQALQRAGVWDAVRHRLVLGENASLATQFVETRNADAGIVPLSLAVQREQFLRYVLLEDSLHDPLMQYAAVLAASRHPGEAKAFLEFVSSPDGRTIMRQYGFVLPGEHVRQ